MTVPVAVGGSIGVTDAVGVAVAIVGVAVTGATDVWVAVAVAVDV